MDSSYLQRLFFCSQGHTHQTEPSAVRQAFYGVLVMRTPSVTSGFIQMFPRVNSSKYRLRLRSHVVPHTYVDCVCRPTYTHTSQEDQMRLLALVFSCSLFPRLCEVDLCPLSGLEGQAVSHGVVYC